MEMEGGAKGGLLTVAGAVSAEVHQEGVRTQVDAPRDGVLRVAVFAGPSMCVVRA